jgi:hypothetical protein
VSDGETPAATQTREGIAARPEIRHAVSRGRRPRRRIGRAPRLSREQAAKALGVSLATLDRRVIPAIVTVKTEWGARLIPARELERYLSEGTDEPRKPRRRPTRSGRRSTLPAQVGARIHHDHTQGSSLAEIAHCLNRDDIPTGQGGRQWWPSTVRAVLLRSEPLRSAREAEA